MTISDLKLEQLSLGELSDGEASALRVLLADDADASARLLEIEASNSALLEAYPPVGVRLEVERRVKVLDLRDSKSRVGLASMPFVLQRLTMSLRWVAVAACVVGAMTFLVPNEQTAPDFRIKGSGAELVVHRVKGDVAERLQEGSVAASGDRLQVSLLGAVGLHVAVVSVDGRGEVTLHHPQTGDTVPVVDAAFSIPNSYQLDDAPHFERFFVVSSTAEIQTTQVLEAARKLVAQGQGETGTLELPSGWTVSALGLKKGR